MATGGLALQRRMGRLLIIIMTLVFAVSLASLTAAQDEDLEDVYLEQEADFEDVAPEDVDWESEDVEDVEDADLESDDVEYLDLEDGDLVGFGFETSSNSWNAGERAYDLRTRQYVTIGGMKPPSGDIIKMKEFSPFWITAEIAGKNIFFSTDANYDDRVDAKASRTPNSVAVHYDGFYVAAFADRTYTIDLLRGAYSMVGSYAEFVYSRGGVPAPRSIQKESRTESAPSPRRVGGQVQTLDVVVTMPDAAQSLLSESDLNVELIGPSHFMATYLAISPEPKERTFTFHDVAPGTYNVEASWGGQSLSKSVVIQGNNAKVELTFE